MLPQRGKQHIACAGHAAAHHKHLRVHGGGNGCQRHAEGIGHLVHLTGGKGVAIAGGIKHILGGKLGAAQGAGGIRVLVQQLLHAAHNAGGTGILLQTSVLAAAAGSGLVAVHRDVADLAAGTVGAINDLAVDDDAAAHAGAQRDHDRAAAALGCAHPDLAQSGHVGVIAHKDPDAAQHGAQLFGYIMLAPAAEVCADDGYDAAVQHRAGHAHAHAFHLSGGKALFLHLALHGSSQIFQNVFTGVGGVGGNFPLFQQLAGGLEQTDLSGGAAQIDAECVFLHSSFTPSAARGRIFHSYKPV